MVPGAAEVPDAVNELLLSEIFGRDVAAVTDHGVRN